MKWFWPIRTGKTFFDVWSICHFASGVVIGYVVGSQTNRFWLFFLISLALGYAWEVVEDEMERWTKMVKHHEVWFNRWISDPMVVLAGSMLGYWLVSMQ